MQGCNADVASSILSNCHTRICFRLGDADAEKFASGFSSFDAKALQNLGVGEAVCRIERSEYDFNLKTFPPDQVTSDVAERRKQAIVVRARHSFGKPSAEIESEIHGNQPITIQESQARKSIPAIVDETKPESPVVVDETR